MGNIRMNLKRVKYGKNIQENLDRLSVQLYVSHKTSRIGTAYPNTHNYFKAPPHHSLPDQRSP